MIPAPVQRALERMIEEDLRGATVISSTANVDAAGRITLEEIILRRPDRREVSIGLAGMRPESTRTEPAIVMDVYDGLGVRRPCRCRDGGRCRSSGTTRRTWKS